MKWTDSQKRLIRKLSGILLLEGVAAPVMPQLSEFTTVNQEQESYYFPIETLRSKNIDLSYFTAPGKGPPGKYQVDVFVNNERIDNRLLLFSADAKGNLVPQLTVKQYEMLGINTTAVPAIRELHSGTVITDISQYAAVTTRLDMNRLRLDIGIPQLLLQNRAKDYIDPALWDTGMPAAFISYDLSGSQSHHNQHNRNSGERRQFLNLRNGINLSGWRLRNYSTWQHGHQGKNEFNSLQNWLEKDMVSLRSRVAAGDTRTSSDGVQQLT